MAFLRASLVSVSKFLTLFSISCFALAKLVFSVSYVEVTESNFCLNSVYSGSVLVWSLLSVIFLSKVFAKSSCALTLSNDSCFWSIKVCFW